jgi:hypothetical protein
MALVVGVGWAVLRYAQQKQARQAKQTLSLHELGHSGSGELVSAAEAVIESHGWFGGAGPPSVPTLRLLHPLVGPAANAHPGRPFVIIDPRGTFAGDVQLARATAGELGRPGGWNALASSVATVYRQTGPDTYVRATEGEVMQLYLPDPADAVAPQTRPASTEGW